MLCLRSNIRGKKWFWPRNYLQPIKQPNIYWLVDPTPARKELYSNYRMRFRIALKLCKTHTHTHDLFTSVGQSINEFSSLYRVRVPKIVTRNAQTPSSYTHSLFFVPFIYFACFRSLNFVVVGFCLHGGEAHMRTKNKKREYEEELRCCLSFCFISRICWTGTDSTDKLKFCLLTLSCASNETYNQTQMHELTLYLFFFFHITYIFFLYLSYRLCWCCCCYLSRERRCCIKASNADFNAFLSDYGSRDNCCGDPMRTNTTFTHAYTDITIEHTHTQTSMRTHAIQ